MIADNIFKAKARDFCPRRVVEFENSPREPHPCLKVGPKIYAARMSYAADDAAARAAPGADRRTDRRTRYRFSTLTGYAVSVYKLKRRSNCEPAMRALMDFAAAVAAAAAADGGVGMSLHQ